MNPKVKKITAVTAAVVGLLAVGTALNDNDETADSSDGLGRETETAAEITIYSETDPETEKSEAIDNLSVITPAEESIETYAESEAAPITPETETETETESLPTETESETEPIRIINILRPDSSMTAELIEELKGCAFFWAPTGDKVHISPECRSFKAGFVFAGTLSEAQSVRTEGWCGICAKGAGNNTITNSNATIAVLENCYSYFDYINKIPAEAFE